MLKAKPPRATRSHLEFIAHNSRAASVQTSVVGQFAYLFDSWLTNRSSDLAETNAWYNITRFRSVVVERLKVRPRETTPTIGEPGSK